MPAARRIGERCPDDGRNDLMHVDQGKLRLIHEKKRLPKMKPLTFHKACARRCFFLPAPKSFKSVRLPTLDCMLAERTQTSGAAPPMLANENCLHRLT